MFLLCPYMALSLCVFTPVCPVEPKGARWDLIFRGEIEEWDEKRMLVA